MLSIGVGIPTDSRAALTHIPYPVKRMGDIYYFDENISIPYVG